MRKRTFYFAPASAGYGSRIWLPKEFHHEVRREMDVLAMWGEIVKKGIPIKEDFKVAGYNLDTGFYVPI